MDAMDDANGEKSSSLSSVSCSICLDLVVADNGERSIAKLQCGHEFHLGIFFLFHFLVCGLIIYIVGLLNL